MPAHAGTIGLRQGEWRAAIRALPPGQAVAAIGDVHGQADLLACLHRALAAHFAGADSATLIHLGDLIDRGPGGRAALALARSGLPGVRGVTLRGNHEDRMLALLRRPDPAMLESWLAYGGAALFRELQISAAGDWQSGLREGLGKDLLGWLDAQPLSYRHGDLFFVHAGIDPASPLNRQTREVLLWTRQRWLASSGPYPEEVAVIHGHTIVKRVDLDHPHRINLDTGAYRTGRLSALLIEGERMRLIQAIRTGDA